jgi:phospholipase/lecithinase/hemolysin
MSGDTRLLSMQGTALNRQIANVNSGPNYVGYLTTKYNASQVFTYNIASGGATVDAALAKPFLPTVHSLIDQVVGDFMPAYGVTPTSKRRAQWTGDDSLFLFFIGVNDVLNTYNANNASLVSKIFSEYPDLVEKVYSSGARNFLFLDVPPLQKSPLSQKYPATLSSEQAALKDWAGRLNKLSETLKSRHPEVMARTFSTYRVFEKILENPKTFPQTTGLKEITGFCDQYSK